MNNAVFRKTIENVRKHTDIKFVKAERSRNYWVLESNYKDFHRISISNRNEKKTEILLDKHAYLGL